MILFSLQSADRRATARTTNFVEPCSFQQKKNKSTMHAVSDIGALQSSDGLVDIVPLCARSNQNCNSVVPVACHTWVLWPPSAPPVGHQAQPAAHPFPHHVPRAPRRQVDPTHRGDVETETIHFSKCITHKGVEHGEGLSD